MRALGSSSVLRSALPSGRLAAHRAAVGGAMILSKSCNSPLTMQSRFQFAQVPGKRDQEAFLSQFDPLDVLCLEESCTIEQIDEAFQRMSAKYGPNGPSPDAKMVDRVFRAHEILKDPGSPYYLRAHTSEGDRQRLQFQLLPKRQRVLIQIQVGLLMFMVGCIALLVISLALRPVKRSLRAATRVSGGVMPAIKVEPAEKGTKTPYTMSVGDCDSQLLFSQTKGSLPKSQESEALLPAMPVNKRTRPISLNRRSTAGTRYAETLRRDRINAAISMEKPGNRAAVWVNQWDRGSRAARLRILDTFLLFHSSSSISLIEEDLGASSILFFTRVTTWLKLTYKLGVELRPLLCAIALFVRGVRYMTCLVENGGAQTLIDALSGSLSLDDRRETLLLLLYMANVGRVYREMLCDEGGVEHLLHAMQFESVIEILNLLATLLIILGEGTSMDTRTRVQTGLLRLILDDSTSLEPMLHAARTLRTFQMTCDRRHMEEMVRSGREDDGNVRVVGIVVNDTLNSSRLLLESLLKLMYHDDLRIRVEGSEMLTLVAKNIRLTTPVLTRCLDVVDEDQLSVEMEDDMARVMTVRRHQFSFGSTAVNIILIDSQCEARKQLVLDLIAKRSAYFTLLKYMRLLEGGHTTSVLDSCKALQVLCRGADQQKNCAFADVPIGVSLERTGTHILNVVGKALYNVLLYEELTEDQSASILRAVKSARDCSLDVKEIFEE